MRKKKDQRQTILESDCKHTVTSSGRKKRKLKMKIGREKKWRKMSEGAAGWEFGNSQD